MRFPDVRRWCGQAVAYALFFAPIGYFSSAPAYQHMPANMATIKLSVRHAGQRLEPCRERSAGELAGLPQTMRALQDCPRQRSPLRVELDVNGVSVVQELVTAPGLHADGMASSYRRLTIPAGRVHIVVRMRDHLAQEHFPYTAEQTFELRPAQILVIDFDGRHGRFNFI